MPSVSFLSWRSAVLGLCLALAPATRADDLEKHFNAPPAAARPWVFWYWMQGAVSRDGITADLAAMSEAGLGGAYLMPINAPADPPVFTPVAKPLTPEWWSLVRHAAVESKRLGIKLAFAVSDGFATAGGPWITPETSMQKVVWSETRVGGGTPPAAPLPQPPANEGYYRDIAVFAYPVLLNETPAAAPEITTDIPGFDASFLATPDGKKQLRHEGPCWIQYKYPTPFTLRSIVVRQWERNYNGVYHATRLRVEASDDGASWREVARLQPPRHGWQDWDADYTFGVPATTARYFRFVHDPAGAEPGGEDLNGAKWKPRLVMRGLLLSSVPRISGFEGKSGAVWRQSARTTAELLPDNVCVPRERILDLTSKLQPDGRLDWTPPPGDWTILRIGHTSTGHHNETATTAKGLESDKLSATATRLQFDRWFGEIARQLGPKLMEDVVNTFHVDSWEAGSQNWTPKFPEEFQRRRGYDLTPWLPLFAGVPITSAAESERVLADVRQTIADLTNDNFFDVLAELAHARGCEFSAEATAPTMTGDGMRHFGRVDVPMGEFWLRSPTHDKPNDILDAISGARVYGKNIVQAEAFTELRMRWDETPALLKPLADRNFALGINRVVLHVFAHNPWLDRRPGMTLNGVGLYFQRDQTWWKEARAWTDYLARCSSLLQVGRPVADVAYFTGEELPSRAILPERRTIPLPDGLAADSINADALLRLAKLENGRLTLPGGASYAALVVPEGPRSPALADKLRELGGPIVATVQSTLNWITPDLLVVEDGGSAADIAWTHRTSEEAEIYFIGNQRDKEREVLISMRAVHPNVEIWNPVTGGIIAAEGARVISGRTEATLRLPPFGSAFIVLRAGESTAAATPRTSAAMELAGPWETKFDPAFGGPAEPLAWDVLSDWSTQADPAIRHYSGSASYTRNFDWKEANGKRAWLDVGTVRDVARVLLNGKDCGVAWTPPYQVEITGALRPGANRLEIHATNTWNNRLLGDRVSPPPGGPVTRTIAPANEKASLLPAGLLGPVRILREE